MHDHAGGGAWTGRPETEPGKDRAMSKLVGCLRNDRETSAVEIGLLAGTIAATAIFVTRLSGDGLAEFLFRISAGF